MRQLSKKGRLSSSFKLSIWLTFGHFPKSKIQKWVWQPHFILYNHLAAAASHFRDLKCSILKNKVDNLVIQYNVISKLQLHILHYILSLQPFSTVFRQARQREQVVMPSNAADISQQASSSSQHEPYSPQQEIILDLGHSQSQTQ